MVSPLLCALRVFHGRGLPQEFLQNLREEYEIKIRNTKSETNSNDQQETIGNRVEGLVIDDSGHCTFVCHFVP